MQQQVRSMVGCLKYLGEKKWDLKTFDKVFKSKKRSLCAHLHRQKGFFYQKLFISFFLITHRNFLFILHLDSALTIYPQQFLDLHLQINCL